jgi:GTP-binding protein HflX
MTRSSLVALDLGQNEFRESIDELAQLATSAGAVVVGIFVTKRRSPDPATFIGSGKVQEIQVHCEAENIELLIFNQSLSPAQQRNLEKILGRRVIDRTGLILDIFAIRAHSFEGKLQVELAQLQYMASRLVRANLDLYGQQGGIGMRGPGETQLETDRRLIGVKVKQLKSRLEKLQKQRQTQRRQRERRGQFSVAIVGYTNAGKSTLFNLVANDKSYTADQLFATLDTTTRRVWLAPKVDISLSDTVGFIRELSHSLVDAFKATLETAVYADLLLHVVDVSSSVRHAQIEQVNQVLDEIGAGEVPQIIIWNKIDACERSVRVERDENGKILSVALSARYGQGISELRECLTELAVGFYAQSRGADTQSDELHSA